MTERLYGRFVPTGDPWPTDLEGIVLMESVGDKGVFIYYVSKKPPATKRTGGVEAVEKKLVVPGP